MTRVQVNRLLIPALGGLFLVTLALGFQLTTNDFFKSLRNRMEWVVYDLRLRFTLPKNIEPHPIIVIIDIDEKSLGREGRWPWPRTKMAELVNKLYGHGITLSVFDVFFVEPEENIALRVRDAIQASQTDEQVTLMEALDRVTPDFEGDRILASSLEGRDVVLGHLFLSDEDNLVQLPPPLPIEDLRILERTTVPVMTGHTGTLPTILAAGRRGGFTNGIPDADGNTRRSPLVLKYRNNIYPALGLEASRVFLANEYAQIKTAPVGDLDVVEFIALDFYDIPTNGEGAVLVPYRGKSPAFRYISATDVIRDKVPEGSLEGVIALIGTSARGLGDLRATPVGSVFPGVEIHANILAGILDQNIPSQPKWAEGANFTAMLVVGAILALLLPFLSPGWLIALTLTLLITLVSTNIWIWVEHRLALSLATPFVMIALLALTNFAHGYLFESKGRRQLKGFFGQYVPPELVEEMSLNPENFGSEGEKREMSVLFSDIRGFTSISEQLSATELANLLNRFFTPMTEIIFNNRGTIDKYVGDMIMAFWGAPVQDPEHALNSIRTGLQMLQKLKELQAEFRALNLPEVNIGIGVNTGSMSVGNMGSEFRRAYTVLGDNVNLASRLEGLTKFYGALFIVGENTRDGQDLFVFRRLDIVRVKGKHEPVTIYEPICNVTDASPQLLKELRTHERALDLYIDQEWAEAKTIFEQLAEQHPETTIYQIYLDRIANIDHLNVGPDWKGVFEHTSK